MKLALVSPAAALQERRDRLRRDRAGALTVRAAFPDVQQLRLDLKFEGTGSSTPAVQSHILHPPARAFFEFPCPYPDCDGRFDVTPGVNAALTDPAHKAEGTLECFGVRPGECGSRQPCQLRLNYTVTAMYQRDI